MTTGFVTDTKTNKSTIDKDPAAILDYIEDWAAWLDALPDTLVAPATATITGDDALLVVNSCVVVGKQVHVWLSGGTNGVKYAVTIRINTSSGRRDERTFYVKAKDR